MEQKKIDEITSIRYVGIEPSFKLFYIFVLSAFGLCGLHHLILKDIKGFIQYWALLLLTLIFSLIGAATDASLFVALLALMGIIIIALWVIPVFLAFYYYIDDDYFESIKNKKSWLILNRMLLLPSKGNQI